MHYTDEYVNMIDAGILDPAKVTRSALQNATSVASAHCLQQNQLLLISKKMHQQCQQETAGMGGMM